MKKFSNELLNDSDDEEDDYDPTRDAKEAVDEDDSDGSEKLRKAAPMRKETLVVRGNVGEIK